MLVAVLVLSACQAGVANETPPQEVEAASEMTEEKDMVEEVASTEAISEVKAEATSEVKAEATTEVKTEVITEEATETESSEDVAKFPVRDEKIPPYEIALRDGSTVTLDQYEGKVLVLTFFTTW